MKNKVFFVSSLSHSGSTLLDMILGTHPHLIGLGEIATVIAPRQNNPLRTSARLCSCGEWASDCPFWSIAVERLEQCKQLDLATGYRIVFETFYELFGKNYIPVDSSKYLFALEELHKSNQYELHILHLIKDVRNYIASQITNFKKQQGFSIKKTLISNQIALAYIWLFLNIKIENYLVDTDLPYLTISYDILCQNPEASINNICNFLEIDYHPDMNQIHLSNSHIIRGNTMRSDASRNSKIIYDSRGIQNKFTNFIVNMLPGIMRYNNRIYRQNEKRIQNSH